LHLRFTITYKLLIPISNWTLCWDKLEEFRKCRVILLFQSYSDWKSKLYIARSVRNELSNKVYTKKTIRRKKVTNLTFKLRSSIYLLVHCVSNSSGCTDIGVKTTFMKSWHKMCHVGTLILTLSRTLPKTMPVFL
jgi:hypothetical protein